MAIRAEGEGEMIRQRYREEFEELGVDDVGKRVAASLWDADKLKAAREWLDEKEHGEDRAYKAEQLKLQRRADLKSTIALVVARLALTHAGSGRLLGNRGRDERCSKCKRHQRNEMFEHD